MRPAGRATGALLAVGLSAALLATGCEPMGADARRLAAEARQSAAPRPTQGRLSGSPSPTPQRRESGKRLRRATDTPTAQGSPTAGASESAAARTKMTTGRPDVSRVSSALLDPANMLHQLGGRPDTARCAARALVRSDISDAALRALVNNNQAFHGSAADTRAITAVQGKLVRCNNG